MKQVKHVLNIKYVQLDTDLIPYFRKYDIFDQLNCLDKTGSFALGAFVKGDDGKDHPVALLVTEHDREERALVIRWLYVESDHRGLGIGSRLLYLLFTEAAERKNTRVIARISDEYLEAAPEWDPERFFMECLFEDEDAMMNEFVFRIGELTGSAAYKNIIRGTASLQPISELSGEEKNRVYEKTEKQVRDLANEEISFVLTEKGAYRAALFVRQYRDVYYPFCLIGESKPDMEKLVRSAMIFLMEAEPTDMLRVECTSIAGEEIMEKLELPGKNYLVSYREASVADYLKLVEEDKKRDGGVIMTNI